MKRVQAVRSFRLASKSLPTRKLAETPTRFHVHNMPAESYLVFPRHSSELRAFIPIGFVEPEHLTGDACLMTKSAGAFHFGLLSSTMHNAWIRNTCGRIKSDFRLSAAIVYNNFPWPGFAGEPLSDKQREAIEAAAQAVLDARAQFPGSSLADLYDPLSMPPELHKAHQKLDAAVDKAYEASGGKKSYKSDAERVAFLFELYQKITSLLPVKPVKAKRIPRSKAA